VDVGGDGSAPEPSTTEGDGLGVAMAMSGAMVNDCGVAVDRPAGEKLGADPADRSIVNVGTGIAAAFLPASQAGSGKAHRLLMAGTGTESA
jgi:hypothetical protein